MTGSFPLEISGSSLSTSEIRCALAPDMVIMTKTIDSIISDIMMFMMYENIEVSSPVVSTPPTTCFAPNQDSAMIQP